MSEHPVGATWEAEANGVKVRIWLEKRVDNIETWKWWSNVKNYYGWSSDWGASYQNCRENAPHVDARFKRVK